MLTMTDQILAMREAGQTKSEITAHLRRLNPSYAPTYLTRYVKNVCYRDRKRKEKTIMGL